MDERDVLRRLMDGPNPLATPKEAKRHLHTAIDLWNLISAWRGQAALDIVGARTKKDREGAHRRERRLAAMLRRLTNLRYLRDVSEERPLTVPLPDPWTLVDLSDALDEMDAPESRPLGRGFGRTRSH